ncbi:alpha/beta fold hydrolase [Clostridium sporogenes]|uniref:prolyl aminopeptidase n=1 Tax=Clostridium botulinum TaxID=1491 RepID=A0A6M0T0C7_CLOBO|nr:alpha/beta fold hydrolase [Clostridium sporogenes]NFA60242.1 alpha/beta fold hydrolase [Clostridium botulinum]NFI72783.1 alpha/beta fold hydrolase [Clostridium sporogenes]NFL72430.1 alpha/beta fold hydrolase [Clostridium sporogenes]NFM23443.1 alpha/beta fold hydrolase [Clostridium sporogenes]NFP60196.1 alpha/beta fold hydrolase [Clostridium sporogenes]
MKNKSRRLIYYEEYVHINGINQYLFHAGTKYENPVMLFLHGGPGFAESSLSYIFQEKWEEIFTVVHWDQRGAGKTLIKNPDKHPTIYLMLKDLFEIIKYLKEKYNKQKIIIIGHSWGTVLGSMFIKKYPEEVAYYIGVGQVISMFENERLGYEKVRRLALQANDKKSLRKLETLGDYPGDNHGINFKKKSEKVRVIQGKYNLAVNWNFSTIIDLIKSPIFKLSDIYALIKMDKVNEEIIEFWSKFDIRLQSTKFKVPIYYILGENDWQTPYIIAEEYFKRIDAPHKKLYLIPNAGYMTMVDQSNLFFKSLLEINNEEKS